VLHRRRVAAGGGSRQHHGARDHLLRLAVDPVHRRVVGVELEFVQREALAGGHRVRPRHVLVEADGHHRAQAAGGAHHVELAGNGQVHLPETVGAGPRKVRVAQQQAAAVGRGVAPEGPAVGAQLAALGVGVEAVAADFCNGLLQVDRGGAGLCTWRGWHGRQHRTRQRAHAALDHRLFGRARQVGHGHRAHPGLASAGGGQAVRPRVLQVAVVAGHVAAQRGLHLGAGGGAGARERGVVHVVADEQVDLRVRHAAQAEVAQVLRAQELRALAAQREQVLGRLADVVLRVRVGAAVGQAFVVGGGDVRNAEGGALDGHAAPGGRRRAGAGGEQGGRAQGKGREGKPGERGCLLGCHGAGVLFFERTGAD
jgi:hypothetical protein